MRDLYNFALRKSYVERGKRIAELDAKLKWLEGLLRMNQICNCCGDHLSEGACANLDCGRYGADQ